MVALGSNDFINNYLMPVYSDSWNYNDDSFNDYLMETLKAQLQVNYVHDRNVSQLLASFFFLLIVHYIFLTFVYVLFLSSYCMY